MALPRVTVHIELSDGLCNTASSPSEIGFGTYPKAGPPPPPKIDVNLPNICLFPKNFTLAMQRHLLCLLVVGAAQVQVVVGQKDIKVLFVGNR